MGHPGKGGGPWFLPAIFLPLVRAAATLCIFDEHTPCLMNFSQLIKLLSVVEYSAALISRVRGSLIFKQG